MLFAVGCGSTDSDQVDTAAQNAQGGTAGASSSGADGAASGSPSTLAVPESCAEFAVEIQRGCEECPALALTCDCVEGWYQYTGARLLPDQACTFGKCLTAIDCDRLCLNIGSGIFGQEFAEDIDAVQDCVSVLYVCDDDADCGTGNLCVYGADSGAPGWGCTEPGHFCNEDADCLQGSHCVVFGMPTDPQTGEAIPLGNCSAGEDGQICIDDDDCVSPYQCVNVNAATGGPTGACSTGENGAPCTIDDDCVTPYQCIARNWACSAGALGDPCSEASECQSAFCFNPEPEFYSGICTSGQYPAECQGPEHCESGRCSVQPDASFGYCTSGEVGAPCSFETDCVSGLCALNPSENGGLCSDGSTGSPCFDGSDCPESTCVAPSNAFSEMCSGGIPGSPCEDDGVCFGGECFKGKCG